MAEAVVNDADAVVSPDNLRVLLAALDEVRTERGRAVAQLAECYRLTGAEPDEGDDDTTLASRAPTEVARLRQELHDARTWKTGPRKTTRGAEETP
jgi:hypothetical protein